ncbi:Retrovirus-related Pol Polyprotein, partial [Phytophthora palmivora]
MEYLGHELSREGIRPVDRLVSAVRDFERPRNEHEVKRFVHLAGYYRKFIEAFGTIMAPLTRLLRKVVEWQWTENEEYAFERMKYILTTKPLLMYPDFTIPFRLVTDASQIGLGACLMQDYGRGWQPIAYASKVNSSTESNYSITELECLAVVWSVKVFRPYLYGRAFTIVTDHSALKWLMTRTNPAGRLHRWALTLQEYDFEVVYRPGSTNVVADALSRAPAAVLAAVGRRAKRGRPPAQQRRADDEPIVSQNESTTVLQPREDKKNRLTHPEARQTEIEHENNENDEQRRQEDDERDAEAPETEPTLQLTDDDIVKAQKQSRLVQKMLTDKTYNGMRVLQTYGLVVIDTKHGRKVILPPALWAVVFKEMHGSVWAGHLRGPHTYGRVAQLYWWPNLQREVNAWVRGCQECGSRKARPREVIPPLRSIRGGDVGDRWALDVAGPFPVSDGGERYVIAALEYVTRYAVARCVQRHTAENVATFLMEDVVLKFGVFREILTDGAPELTGYAIELLVAMLQARQINPVPYRPQMIGLVERFHRSWKDVVSTFMSEEHQSDWQLWVKFAVYAYNSARHSTVALSPNELMMGRKLRTPNELLRRPAVTEAGELKEYHGKLLRSMKLSHECAERARLKEQERQAKYYNRNTRMTKQWKAGDRVWMYNPPRGPSATKFVHRWMGPLKILEPAGYENFLLQREDKTGSPELIIAHASFLVSYHYPKSTLRQAAADINAQLNYENSSSQGSDVETYRAAVRSATAAADRTATSSSEKRRGRAVPSSNDGHDTSGKLVEERRRKRRNRAGQYVLEYLLRPIGDPTRWRTDDGSQWITKGGRPQSRWIGVSEYDRLFDDERVVEDP